jgi:hypothetical protein
MPFPAFSVESFIMDASSSAAWPPRSYHIGPKDHLHALGVVAALYNNLEFSLFGLFYMYSGISGPLAQSLFGNMSNAQRADFLTKCIDEARIDVILKELAYHFIQCFSICAENRNFLMHATIHPHIDPEQLTFRKSSREDPARFNTINAGVTAIRKVANSFHEIDNFGVGVFTATSSKLDWKPGLRVSNIRIDGVPFEPPLPQKPPLPDKLLTPAPKAPKPERNRRESPRQRRERVISGSAKNQ